MIVIVALLALNAATAIGIWALYFHAKSIHKVN